jgi:hypothetical protein
MSVARLDDKSQRVWSSETTTDDTTAGYRRIPGTSIDTISTKFSVGTGVTLRSRCDVASLGLNPWDVHSVDTVVAGGDRLHEVVGDKANALK